MIFIGKKINDAKLIGAYLVYRSVPWFYHNYNLAFRDNMRSYMPDSGMSKGVRLCKEKVKS